MATHEPAGNYEKWLTGVRDRLRAAREARGLSYRAAESLTGVPFASIQRIEAGRVDPSLGLLYTLANRYGLDMAALLAGAKK